MSVAAHAEIVDSPEVQGLRTLYRLLASLSTASALEDVYEAAISSLLEATSADRAAILQFGDDGVIRFKASRGLSEEYRQTVTGHSPWKQGEQNAGPLLVPDVCDDPDLSNYRNAFMREGIRALAFIPLALESGVFGKFMLYYREPHSGTAHEIGIAQAIAAHVSLAVARKSAEEAHRRAVQRLESVLENSPAVIFIKDIEGRYTFVNRRYKELFDDNRQVPGRSDHDVFPPHFAERFQANDRAVVESGGPREFEECAPHADGVHTYVSVKFPLKDPDGRIDGICGIATDITERKRIESESMLLVEASSSLLALPYSAEVRTTIIKMAQRFVSADAYAIWQQKPDESWILTSSVGLSDEFLQAGTITQPGAPALLTAPLVIRDVTREPILERRREVLHREGIHSMLVVPLRSGGAANGTVVFYWREPPEFSDSEVRMAAAIGNLAASALSTAELYEHQLRSRERAETAERRAAFLAKAGAELASSLDFEKTLAAVAKLAVPAFADWAAIDILDDDGGVRRVAAEHSNPDRLHLPHEFQHLYPRAFRTGESVLINLAEMIDHGVVDAEHAAAIRRLGLHSLIVAPMIFDNRPRGIIAFATAESGRVYDVNDRQTAEELGRRTAIAVEQARLHREALNNEERLRAIVETTPECVKVIAPDGTLLYMNSSGLEMIGANRLEEVIGTSVYDIIAPEFRDRYRAFNEAICTGERGSLEFDVVGLTGERRQMETRAVPLRSDGPVVHLALTRDVTGRKQRESAALLLSSIVDSSDDAIISKDLNGIITSWNKSAERLFGYTAEEALGQPVAALLIPPDRKDEEPKILQRLRHGERVDHFETIRQHKDGSLLDISLTVSPVKDTHGAVIGASKIARDITDRRRTEKAIQTLNAQLTADLQAMARMQQLSARLLQADDFPQLLGEIIDAGMEITEADTGDIRLLEEGVLRIVAQRGFEGPLPDGLSGVYNKAATFGAALFEGRRLIVEDVAADPLFAGTPGESVMLAAGARAMQATPLISRSGKVLGTFSTYYRVPRQPADRELRLLDILARQAADLIERTLAGAELLSSETRFRQLANSMPQIVWTARPDGSADYYNERWYELTGLTRENPDDTGWEGALHPDDIGPCRQAWLTSVTSGDPYNIEHRFRDRRENRWRWFISRALPVRGADGNIVKWYGSSTDIDEQKRVEDDLRRANQDLEQFAFSASHDLREPLRSVKIYSELLANFYSEALDEQGLEFLTYLSNGATRMEMLVRDLLAYTQSGGFERPAGLADAGEALSAALANLAGSVAESGAVITSGEMPHLHVHATHLQQVFQNLIGNAVKYRHPGRRPVVNVTAERRNEHWVFTVLDNGIGIDPRYKETIFGLFKRLHTSDEYSGTGIGLAICKRIVDRYQGRIWVESESGSGSAFHFSLPL